MLGPCGHPDGSITLQTITGLSAVQLEWKGVPFTFGIREADDVLRVVGFPSYEIVRSFGLAGFIADNVHVRPDLVRSVTTYMVDRYSIL